MITPPIDLGQPLQLFPSFPRKMRILVSFPLVAAQHPFLLLELSATQLLRWRDPPWPAAFSKQEAFPHSMLQLQPSPPESRPKEEAPVKYQLLIKFVYMYY